MSDDEAVHTTTLKESIEELKGLSQKQKKVEKGEAIFGDLYVFVYNLYNYNDDDDDDDDTGWRIFHDMLKLFEGTDVELRKLCLFTPGEDFDEDEFPDTEKRYDCSLLHEVCNHNPPAEVVETLLGIIPVCNRRTNLDSDIEE